MGATSLIPMFMSLALLSKTTVDLTHWGQREKRGRGEERRERIFQSGDGEESLYNQVSSCLLRQGLRYTCEL